MEINDLPDEMVGQVHQWLPMPALKEAVLVCRLWRKEGEDPSLWKWCKVTVFSKDDIGNLAIKRIKHIQEIKINPQNWNDEDWEAFFLATMELLNLKFIDGLPPLGHRGFGALVTVERGVFARALVKLEVVELRGTPYEQIEELFREMARSTKIKKLHLENHDLSRMDPNLFATVLSRLEDVRLSFNNTTNHQMRAFFSQIVEKNCLKRLNLKEKSVSHLEPGLFAQALAKVEEVTLGNLGDDDEDDNGDQIQNRTNDQIEALFTELSHGTQMKKLVLDDFNLSQVESREFATSMSRLETQGLRDCDVTNDQKQALFTEMLRNTQTKKLELDFIDLSQLEPGLLAGVLAKLEEVALCYPRLTSDQVQAFFTEASLNTHLKTLDMHHVNLSHVDSEVLAQAVSRLEEVTLGGMGLSDLTDDQYQSLFTEMAVNTKLKKLEIYCESILSVNPQVLATTLNKLDELKLYATDLTHDQAETFFLEMARETKLKKLHFMNDLSALDPEILGTSLTKLKEVTLEGTSLTREKIEAVLTHVLEAGNSKLRKLQWGWEYGVLYDLNPETVNMLQHKLKGEFKLNY